MKLAAFLDPSWFRETKTPQIRPNHTVITSQNRYFWVPNNDTIAHKIPFNLQHVQAMWPFANYFIHPLNMLTKNIPILLLESLHTFLRGEGMNGLSLILQKMILSQGSKKNHRNEPGSNPPACWRSRRTWSWTIHWSKWTSTTSFEGRELGTSWRGKGRSTRRTPWKRETPRSWNHLKTNVNTLPCKNHLGVTFCGFVPLVKNRSNVWKSRKIEVVLLKGSKKNILRPKRPTVRWKTVVSRQLFYLNWMVWEIDI